MIKEPIPFNPSDFGLNDIKIIVLVETVPLTGNFEQLEFTLEQYKKLSNFLMYFYNPVFDDEGNAEFDTKTTDFEIKLDKDIQPYTLT